MLTCTCTWDSYFWNNVVLIPPVMFSSAGAGFQWRLNFKQEALWYYSSVVLNGLSLLLLGKMKATPENHLVCSSCFQLQFTMEARHKEKGKAISCEGNGDLHSFLLSFFVWLRDNNNKFSSLAYFKTDFRGVLWLQLVSSQSAPLVVMK